MADAAAARREARRRRILENSHNRLQLISGKTCDEDARASPIKYQPPCDEEQVITNTNTCSSNVSSNHNGALVTEKEMLEFLSANHHDASGDGGNEFTPIPSYPTAAQKPPTMWEHCIVYKYDVLLVSLAVQILYSMNITPGEGLYFFLPIVTYIVMKLMLFPTNNQSKLGSVLMLINLMAPNHVQRILFILQLALTFVEDFCIFLFCTICSQAFLLAIKGKLTI